jgi:hypothetical protein
LKVSTPAATKTTAQIELERTPPPCDRCRQSALTIVERRHIGWAPLHLSFCGHHYGVNEALLVLAGWALIGDTRAHLATREASRRFGGMR